VRLSWISRGIFIAEGSYRGERRMKHYILFIDDNDELRASMQSFFDKEGFTGKCVATGEEGIALVRQKVFNFSLALVDYHLPDMNGAQIIARLREFDSDLIALGFSDDKSDPVHNMALDSGAISFINKDAGDAKLLGILHRHCREFERRKKPLTITTKAANQKFIEALEMAGCSNHLAEISRLTLKYAQSPLTVLIRGENGTGKEKVARAIHNHSTRRLMPFIAVNCAAFPKDLIESELFGHEKGSFTGAGNNKIGKFQAANGGTIFLDEIGELDPAVQAVLLRVLQEKTFMPVGSNITKKVDVRVVAATNAPLEDMIAMKAFREDLFYRLNVLPIHLKPLRERPEDIPYLIEYFLKRANETASAKKIILNADVEKLMKLPWAGNVRDLEHSIEYLMIVCDGPTLDISKLKDRAPTEGKSIPKLHMNRDLDAVGAAREKIEHQVIVEAIGQLGSVAGAARDLKMSRSTLRDKMKKYGIKIRKLSKKEMEL
jgi:two-component system, NtrC family, nitrogen regulation response regulator NtrX